MHPVEVENLPNDHIKYISDAFCSFFVAGKFVTLYYRVLSKYSDYLSRFYGSDSTVVICSMPVKGEQQVMKAEGTDMVHKLLSKVYAEVAVSVRSCTSQPSTGGCLSLLVTGVMKQKHGTEEMLFNQALILARQRDGYYIKTDTVLVLHQTSSCEGKGSFLESVLPSTATSVPTEGALKVSTMESDISVLALNAKFSNDTNSSKGNLPIDNQPGIITLAGVDQENAKQTSNAGLTQTRTSVESKTAVVVKNHSEDALCNSTFPITSNSQFSYTKNLNANDTIVDGGIAAMTCVAKDAINIPFLVPETTSLANIASMNAKGGPTQPPSGSPGDGVNEATHNPPTALRSLFACKLPLNVTVEEVTEVFTKFGALEGETPVKVFTGPTNCYAYVNFTNEESLQKALKEKILIRSTEVVTDEWRPREKPAGRLHRRARMNGSKVVTAN